MCGRATSHRNRKTRGYSNCRSQLEYEFAIHTFYLAFCRVYLPPQVTWIRGGGNCHQVHAAGEMIGPTVAVGI